MDTELKIRKIETVDRAMPYTYCVIVDDTLEVFILKEEDKHYMLGCMSHLTGELIEDMRVFVPDASDEVRAVCPDCQSSVVPCRSVSKDGSVELRCPTCGRTTLYVDESEAVTMFEDVDALVVRRGELS